MRHIFRVHRVGIFCVTLALIVLSVSVPAVTECQTLAVQGSVTASSVPVRFATITFMNAADTNVRFVTVTDADGHYSTSVPTSVASKKDRPAEFALEQNYPNPFASSTAISYSLKQQGDVLVTVFDILGREVRKFAVGMQQAGTHGVVWDGRDDHGIKVAVGVYFYSLRVGEKMLVKKMIFGTGDNNSVTLPAEIFALEGGRLLKETGGLVQSGTYQVRVESSDSTSPSIFTQNKPVTLYGDTTLNFITGLNAAVVYFDSTEQLIRGFGASNIVLWRPDMTDSEIQTAFGTDDGELGFSILRIMVEKDSTRWALSVPSAQKAQAMGATIIASPWYAPDSLAELVNSGAIQRVRHDKYAEYAAHLNSFLTFMKNNGVTVYGISVQNEPDITDNWTSWTSDEMFTFMKDYAHLIEGAKVMDPESFHFSRTYSDPILNDSAACANTDIICGHIYGGGLTSYPLAQSKGKEVWMTEYLINSPGSGQNMDTSLAAAVVTAKTISDCMKAKMNAYVWWYIVRYYGPISDGTFGVTKGVVTKKGAMMSNFARFVRPGYSMVDVVDNGTGTMVEVTAYRLAAKKVIVAINRKTTEKLHTFDLQHETAGSFAVYVTSGSKNCELENVLNYTNGTFRYTLPPQSVTTFVSF